MLCSIIVALSDYCLEGVCLPEGLCVQRFVLIVREDGGHSEVRPDEGAAVGRH